MSYCIRYETKKHPWQRRIDRRKRIVLILSLSLILLLIGHFWVGRSHSLLPGDADVTALALDNMSDALASGESLKEAIVTFCQEILDSADSAR